jgi:NAD(P)-dependent dehydrogenase (short-subunit alcohol dehydrogenase family)
MTYDDSARGSGSFPAGEIREMTHRLAGKSVLITGASSGIGRAIARRFAAEGARLVLADVTEQVREGGVPTAELLCAEGYDVTFVPTDVSLEEDAIRAVDVALHRFGRLDVLVNDAAIGVGKRLTDTGLDEWNRALAVNLTGTFLMARAAVAQMLKQEVRHEARGRIVNISSQHGMIACPEDIAYGTSKSGVVYMTRQIAVDYAKDFIICNAVAPGKILTGKTGRAVEPRWLDYSQARTPMPRLGTPDDVASAALFLASDEASFITGENILVDGGWMAA